MRATGLLMRAQFAENMGDQVHMRADLERAAAAFRDVGDNWGLAVTLSSQAGTLMLIDDLDGAETALDEATELLEALNGSTGAGAAADAARRHPAAPRRPRRRPRARCCARSRTPTCSATRACSCAAAIARIAWLAGDVDELRRLRRPTPPPGSSGSGRSAPSRVTSAPSSRRLATIVALEDGDAAAVEAKLAARLRDRASATDRHADRRHGRRRRRRGRRSPRPPRRCGGAARRRRGPARGRGSLQPRGRPPASTTLRATLGDDAFAAAYDARPRADLRGGRRPARQARRP